MTRQEEITKAAELAYSPSSGIMQSLTISIFKEGAKWADKTMIDKVCEWLDGELIDVVSGINTPDISSISFNSKKELLSAFRKTLE